MNEIRHEAPDRIDLWGMTPAPNSLPTLVCVTCGLAMERIRTIPKLGVLPKLRVFCCPCCNDVQTNEA